MTKEHNEETLEIKRRKLIISLEIFIVIFFIALTALTIKSNRDYEEEKSKTRSDNYIGLSEATDILNGWLVSQTGETGGVSTYDLASVVEYPNQVNYGESKYTCYDFVVKYNCTEASDGKCLTINDETTTSQEEEKYVISGSLLTKGIKYNLTNEKCSEQK